MADIIFVYFLGLLYMDQPFSTLLFTYFFICWVGATVFWISGFQHRDWKNLIKNLIYQGLLYGLNMMFFSLYGSEQKNISVYTTFNYLAIICPLCIICLAVVIFDAIINLDWTMSIPKKTTPMKMMENKDFPKIKEIQSPYHQSTIQNKSRA